MSALVIRYGNPEALPIDVLLSAIPSLSRVALDRLVDRAIEEMDGQDGDPDLEDDDPDQCLAGDDGCGPILHRGRVIWGEASDGESDV